MSRRILILLAVTTLAACSTSRSPGNCAFVDADHLARPHDGAGRATVCNPRQVSPAHREQYFTEYKFGDESWVIRR